jgi:hypothetical protein
MVIKMISSRVRNQAAIFCATAASNFFYGNGIVGEIDCDDDAHELASQAWAVACGIEFSQYEVWAEAEAMIRSGWVPWS